MFSFREVEWVCGYQSLDQYPVTPLSTNKLYLDSLAAILNLLVQRGRVGVSTRMYVARYDRHKGSISAGQRANG